MLNLHVFSGANNLIPMEIALKIAEKIRANERFAVYIVIPMWPEGVPTGAATQRILFWQVRFIHNMKAKFSIKSFQWFLLKFYSFSCARFDWTLFHLTHFSHRSLLSLIHVTRFKKVLQWLPPLAAFAKKDYRVHF